MNEMNNMNNYGNNLNAPYGQTGYSPYFFGKNYNQYQQQQETPTNNLLWVQGIEGAKALMLPPNSKVICLDSEIENRAYIKISDELGATKLRKFDIIEVFEDAETTSKDLSDYVRKDELQELIMTLLPGKEVIVDEQPTQSTQPTVVRRTVAAK